MKTRKPLDDYPDVLTIREVMDVTGLGKNTVYESVHRGEIPHVKFGKTIRVPKVALRRLFETGGRVTA